MDAVGMAARDEEHRWPVEFPGLQQVVLNFQPCEGVECAEWFVEQAGSKAASRAPA
jgi:hypothetical protein